MTHYDRIGGEDALRVIVHDFVGRFFEDFIIGFMFEGRDRARIERHEVELAAAHLGGPNAYTGRPLAAVHKPLKINRGHFRRRLAIVRFTLLDHGVDDDIVERWLGAEARLEPSITTGADCVE